MRIANTIQDSIVDGPGLRFVVFTQGCEFCCEGCHNQETWDVDGGVDMPVGEIIAQMLGNPLTDGLTMSGGEPFLQAVDCAKIAKTARENGLNVWVYTGYTFEELMAEPGFRELLCLTDVLIDGPFRLAERSLNIKWRGSQNQRVIDVKKSLAAGGAVLLEV
ncbi:MAG: anaerobic ribonucleoside-triphosphate reductase activating protein [Oscillospiraceae bacterium]|nr:anaerobic ribonucleoside-triphosphate reductase activating protein [Oscillospiraceae bacterium]